MPQSPTAAGRPGAGTLGFAWAGALLFGVSLAAVLYAYTVPFARPAGGPSLKPAFIDTGLFTIFALHHSILARGWAKRAVTAVVPAWLERSLFTWIASLLLLMVIWLWRPVGGLIYAVPPPWHWFGYAVQVAGIVVTAASASAIDVLDLAGVRPILDARRRAPARHVPLETGGVYAVVRHPVYLGWALVFFGAPLMTATRFTFAVVSTAYLAAAIPLEERSLVRVFGNEYRAYRSRTRWRMVPGLW
jgi:protein-S-isoprenylcysteine O-methyltransferase Ste14